MPVACAILTSLLADPFTRRHATADGHDAADGHATGHATGHAPPRHAAPRHAAAGHGRPPGYAPAAAAVARRLRRGRGWRQRREEEKEGAQGTRPAGGREQSRGAVLNRRVQRSPTPLDHAEGGEEGGVRSGGSAACLLASGVPRRLCARASCRRSESAGGDLRCASQKGVPHESLHSIKKETHRVVFDIFVYIVSRPRTAREQINPTTWTGHGTLT